MIKNTNKKGAVEMSLNLIIMLIIGMVVLGLVIGFVNSLVNKGAKSFDDQLGDNERLKLDEVKNCPDVFCINPEPTITISKGGKVNVFIKIRNVGQTDDVNIGAGPATTELIRGEIFNELGDGFTADDTFILSGPGFQNMEAGTDMAQMYTLRVADATNVGVYYVSFGVDIDGDEYTKTITVNVE